MFDNDCAIWYTKGASYSKADFVFFDTGSAARIAQSNILRTLRPIRKSACRRKQHDPLIGRNVFKGIDHE